LATVALGDDADNIRYDAPSRLLYVGCGRGALAVVETASNRHVGEIALAAHPESFQLERDGARVFVNVPSAHDLVVADRTTRKILAKWPLGFVGANFPMALDEAAHRLFVGCRVPARLLVFDTATGRELAKFDLHGDCDDLFFDATRHLLYASCGEGFIDVFNQTDADHYTLRESVPTVAKARTCFFDGTHLYLAVPKSGAREAAVRVYDRP
jgi:hypothetical protein